MIRAVVLDIGSVLEVIYLVFNEGYSATAGDDWIRPALMEEALRLGRVGLRVARFVEVALVRQETAA